MGATARLGAEEASRRLTAGLAEYAALRQEVQSAITNRITIYSFSFGAIAVAASALVTTDLAPIPQGLLALLAIPLAAKASLLIWLGEYNRSQRVGSYLRTLEPKLQQLAQGEDVVGDVPGWETWLADRKQGKAAATSLAGQAPGRHMSYPYLAVSFLLWGSGAISFASGVWVLSGQAARMGGWAWAATLSAMIVLGLLEVVYVVYYLRKLARIETECSGPAPAQQQATTPLPTPGKGS